MKFDQEIESIPAYLGRCVRRDWRFLLIVFLLLAATVVYAMTGGRARPALSSEPSSMEMSRR